MAQRNFPHPERERSEQSKDALLLVPAGLRRQSPQRRVAGIVKSILGPSGTTPLGLMRR
jgi:hypothetical protein